MPCSLLAAVVDELLVVALVVIEVTADRAAARGVATHGALHRSVGVRDHGRDGGSVEAVRGQVITVGHLLEEGDLAHLGDHDGGVCAHRGDLLVVVTVELAVAAFAVTRAADVDLDLRHDAVALHETHVDDPTAHRDVGEHLRRRILGEPVAAVVDRLEGLGRHVRTFVGRDLGASELVAADVGDARELRAAIQGAHTTTAKLRVQRLAAEHASVHLDAKSGRALVIANADIQAVTVASATARRGRRDQRGHEKESHHRALSIFVAVHGCLRAPYTHNVGHCTHQVISVS